MKKRAQKIAINPYAIWLGFAFSQNRPPCISIHAGLSDFLQKFTRGSDFFFDPLVNAPLKPSPPLG
jgi:hypothetical protein